MLDRLIGLETEYAIRRRCAPSGPTRFALYQTLLRRVRSRIVTVPAKHFKDGVFLATGGAIWFETERPAMGQGLVEGATPECRGPREAVCYQRAQDILLGQAARDGKGEDRFSLIKNDRDGHGNVYGAQENYEAVLAKGAGLLAWRIGVLLLTPLVLLTWLGLLLIVVALLVYFGVVGLAFWLLHRLVKQPRQLAIHLFGGDLVEGCATGQPVPIWMETVMFWMTRMIQTPLALCVWGLAAMTAFRTTRRQLVPFLISRCVIAGAGMLDKQGKFLLADKAPAVNCLVGLGNVLHDRPMFTMGHFFKAICADPWLVPRTYFSLFKRRQRLQIGLGDSNMAETAEFLRVGTTALLLDVIEMEGLRDAPRVRSPIAALQRLVRDPTLTTTVLLADGRQWTGLQLQRYYWELCRDFVARHFDFENEAREIITRWDEVLCGLEQIQTGAPAPTNLVGQVDWVTKKYLLDHAVSSDWNVLKKIDIRYHELTGNGYFMRLQSAGLTTLRVDPAQLEHALRVPPRDTPATMRGHFIREFSGGTEPVTANWSQVVWGRGRNRKVVDLHQFQRHRALRQRGEETVSGSCLGG